MTRGWRLVDTGLRSAAQNIALDRALLEARRADEIPATLRFFRTTRSALLGLQQSACQELNADYCRTQSIPIQRRITGGATYLTDPAQLGWSLYVQKRELADQDLRGASRQHCHAIASALSGLGVDARVRRHDEIEIDGRAVGGCGVAADGDALVFHGWIFIDLHADTVVQALRLPAAYSIEHLRACVVERYGDLTRATRASGRAPDVRQIKQNISEAIESAYEVECIEGDLSLSEESRYRAALPEIDTEGWSQMVTRPLAEALQAEAVERVGKGTLRAALIVDSAARTLKSIWLISDNPPNPRRTLLDLEAELRDVPLARLKQKIEWFFASRTSLAELRADDVVTLIARALRQPLPTPNS